MKPVKVVSTDELDRIRRTSLVIQKEVGIDFRDEIMLEQAGRPSRLGCAATLENLV